MLSRKKRRRLRNWLVAWLAPPLVRLWGWSLRKRICSDGADGPDGSEGLEEKDGWVHVPGVIVLVWHQRLFTLATSFPNSGFRTMISQHDDGEMLVGVLKGIGLEAIRGSSTRGFVGAIRELLRNQGKDVRIVITPDGPLGPPMKLQQGAIYLASKTGLPILVTGIGLSSSWTFKSWDRFKLPLPFSRALLRIGKLIRIPPDLNREEIEQWRIKVEKAMCGILTDTDERFEELYREANRLRGMRRT